MSLWGGIKRVGLGVATGGLSEIPRLPGAMDTDAEIYTPDKEAAKFGRVSISGRTDLGRAAQGRAVTGQAVTGRAATGNAALSDKTQQGQFRQGQTDLTGQLAAQARGEGPSLATEALRQGAVAQQNQAQSIAAGSRGMNTAAAARLAAEQGATAQQNLAGSAVAARMQEQLDARNQLAGVLSQGRSSDIDLAQSDQAARNQMTSQNLDARNQMTSQNVGAQNQMTSQNLAAQNAMVGMNVGAQNQFGLQQGQMDQQNNQFNAAIPGTPRPPRSSRPGWTRRGCAPATGSTRAPRAGSVRR